MPGERPEDRPQDCGVFKMRNIILEKMFELFSRVESRIRESVEKGFRILLKAEQFEKEIMSQEKMEQCFSDLSLPSCRTPTRKTGEAT